MHAVAQIKTNHKAHFIKLNADRPLLISIQFELYRMISTNSVYRFRMKIMEQNDHLTKQHVQNYAAQ